MKYAVVIPDGAADLPIAELDDRTPLQAARTPHLDVLAAQGRVGLATTTPEGFEAGSDVCSMCLLGYDPARWHTGRAPLEAAAMGLQMEPGDWIFRVNFVYVGTEPGPDSGRMLDHSGGALRDAEGRLLARDLVQFWLQQAPEAMRGLALTHGKSYRNILIDSSGRDYSGLQCTPPHEIPALPWAEHVPSGPGAEHLIELMELSRTFLPGHEVNRARRAAGQRVANMAWIWGGGTRPAMESFKSRFGLRGAMTSPVDLLTGIARSIGWEVIDVPGMTSYHDNDYAAQARAACAALDKFDLVCCHVESPDELSHQGDWRTKVAAIEAIDREIIGPLTDRLKSCGDPEHDPRAEGWRLLVMPDHYTLCGTRLHDPTPVPFLMAGAWIRSIVRRNFNEVDAATSDLRIESGHELMEYFLRGGLARVRS